MKKEQNISRARLLVNGIGSIAIALLCLPVGVNGVIGLLSGSLSFGSDPDGADKVLAIEFFSAIVGTVAVISLILTLKKWRESPDQ